MGGRTQDDNRCLNGRLAEIGVWNRALDAGEIALLSQGISPLTILRGLKFYAPLLGQSTELNYLGAPASTMDGSTVIAHPRVTYPGNRRPAFYTNWHLNTVYTGGPGL